MKKSFILILLTTVLIKANAQNYKMALGIRFSNDDAIVNNSISFKYFVSDHWAVESLFSLSRPMALGLLAEKHKQILSKRFNYFFGAGAYASFGKTKTGEERYAGLQGILGLDYKLPVLPINFSIDLKPEINLIRDLSFEPAAIGFSARFVF